MTSRHLFATLAGSIHASSVNAVESWSELELGMFTRAFVPLKESAPPYRPVAVRTALEIVPLFPPPAASTTVEPDPSSNAYAATRPLDAPRPTGTAANAVETATAKTAKTKCRGLTRLGMRQRLLGQVSPAAATRFAL